MNQQTPPAGSILASPLVNLVKLPSFSPPSAGADTTLDIPQGPLYKRLWIKYSGVTLAQLKNIEVRQNGTTFQTFRTGAELDKINQYFGHQPASGWLVIDFDDSDAFTIGGLDLYGWQTNPAGSNFATGQIKISIDAAAAGPALECYAEQAQYNDRAWRRTRTFRTYDYNAAAIGDYEISDLPKGGSFDQLGRVYFHNANISKVRLKMNNVELYEVPEALNDRYQEDVDRVPDASTYIFDPSAYASRRTGAIISTIDVSDFRFILSMSAAGAIPLTVEYRELLS